MKRFAIFSCCIILFTCRLVAQVAIGPFHFPMKDEKNDTHHGIIYHTPTINNAAWKTGTGRMGFCRADADCINGYSTSVSHYFICNRAEEEIFGMSVNFFVTDPDVTQGKIHEQIVNNSNLGFDLKRAIPDRAPPV